MTLMLQRLFRPCSVVSLAVLLTLGLTTAALASNTETVLHTFTNGSDGGQPYAGLIMGNSGNLYGTAETGGQYGYGVVFELTPSGGGGWTYNVLYSFTGGDDGAYPLTGSLVFDSQGNLYGTCSAGGTYTFWGTVFELSPSGGGNWAVSKSYSFTGGTDGSTPVANVILDSAGNLYSTTEYGGVGYGIVFELTPSGNSWTERRLHTFTGGSDGSTPGLGAGVIMDRAGNLYGTTLYGGSYNTGVVFKLHNTGNSWLETVLYNFTGNLNGDDGAWPSGSLAFDNAGRIYGTTSGTTSSGSGGYGGVFQLSVSPTAPRTAGREWQITWPYRFTGGSDGGIPASGVVLDSAGDLYGTTYQGGADGFGVVFKLIPSPWNESVLWSFTGGSDGSHPFAGVTLDSAGNLYSTASSGGSGSGVAFELTQ
jgi:uncharacterized repeat protein (TIGR03803 family)